MNDRFETGFFVSSGCRFSFAYFVCVCIKEKSINKFQDIAEKCF
jgi:hypothetical protein